MLGFLDSYCHKNEAIRFNYILNNSIVTLYDDNDFIWSSIINKARQIDRLRQMPEYSRIPCELPFKLGDVVGIESGLPDVIYHTDKLVLGIECFQIDSSKKTKKGSTMKRDMQIMGRKTAEVLKVINQFSHSRMKIKSILPTNFSFEDYINSLFSTFKSHAKNVEKYRISLKKNYPGKEVLLAFHIEDATPLGSYVRSDSTTEAFNPLFLKEFIDVLSRYSGIDYIIVSNLEDLYVPATYIQKIDTINLKKLNDHRYTINDKFLAFNYSTETIIPANNE